tara:strand:+ start:12911 stop:13396 length:486 start_codon:yes stop_codon:yes gene_type:complete
MSSNHETESKKFEFQTIKNRFSTYEERCAKRAVNLNELLRSQVEPAYTPKYVDGSYIKPGVSIEHNTELDDSDGYWRMWFFDLSEASGTVDVKVTVTFTSTLQETLTVSGLNASVNYGAFLDSFIAAVSSSSVTVEKYCDTCIKIDSVSGEEIFDISATIS